jgi:hypothetical protein
VGGREWVFAGGAEEPAPPFAVAVPAVGHMLTKVEWLES